MKRSGRMLAAVLLSVLLSVALGAAPVGAVSDDWIDEALYVVLDEVILLSEGGATTSDPLVDYFVAEFGFGFTSAERNALLEELDFADEDGEFLFSIVDAPLSPEAQQVLDLISASDWSRLQAGETGFMDPGPYLDGLTDILRRRGRAPSGTRDPAERDILRAWFDDSEDGEYQLSQYFETTTTTAPPTTVAPTTTAAPTTAAPTTTSPTVAPTTAQPSTTASSGSPTTATTRRRSTTPDDDGAQTSTGSEDVDATAGLAGATGDEGTTGDGAGGDSAGGGDADADGTTLPGAGGTDAGPANDGDTTSTEPPSSDEDEGDAPPIMLSFALGDEPADADARRWWVWWPPLAISIVVAFVLWFVARRRQGDDGEYRGIARIGLLLSECDTADAIVLTVVPEVVQLVEAEAGAYHRVADLGLTRWHTSAAEIYPSHQVASGVLAEVVERVASTCRTVEWEAGFAAGPFAMAAVPVVLGDEVIGVVSVTRAEDEPFGEAKLELLGDVAALLAGALDKAGRLESAREESTVDWLTALPNRRRFDNDVADMAPDEAVCVAMVDIDHFKNFNDTYGHETGDVVIRAVADKLASGMRTGDGAYRYGGEEFAILLPGSDLRAAAGVVERIRVGIQRMALPETPSVAREGGTTVTVSIGITAGRAGDVEQLLRVADQALYKAKQSGRNRVIIARPPKSPGLPVSSVAER